MHVLHSIPTITIVRGSLRNKTRYSIHAFFHACICASFHIPGVNSEGLPTRLDDDILRLGDEDRARDASALRVVLDAQVLGNT